MKSTLMPTEHKVHFYKNIHEKQLTQKKLQILPHEIFKQIETYIL